MGATMAKAELESISLQLAVAAATAATLSSTATSHAVLELLTVLQSPWRTDTLQETHNRKTRSRSSGAGKTSRPSTWGLCPS